MARAACGRAADRRLLLFLAFLPLAGFANGLRPVANQAVLGLPRDLLFTRVAGVEFQHGLVGVGLVPMHAWIVRDRKRPLRAGYHHLYHSHLFCSLVVGVETRQLLADLDLYILHHNPIKIKCRGG